MVQNGEKVIIPFCSVGPFVVHVGAKGADIVAFEKITQLFPCSKKIHHGTRSCKTFQLYVLIL